MGNSPVEFHLGFRRMHRDEHTSASSPSPAQSMRYFLILLILVLPGAIKGGRPQATETQGLPLAPAVGFEPTT